MPINSTARDFVDLVRQYNMWSPITSLPEDEVQILFTTVSVAGFNAGDVVPGKIVHKHRQGTSSTAITRSINCVCPFKVIDHNGNDHRLATGWLDCALRRVSFLYARGTRDDESIIEEISKEIERSIPLTPIQLTPGGDMLCEFPPVIPVTSTEYFVDHTKDHHVLSGSVGLHMHCDGVMERREISEVLDAIVCKKCRRRVPFPQEVETYGDLRKALKKADILVPA